MADDVLGVIDDYTPGWYLRLEEKIQDKLLGLIGNSAREAFANIKIPESLEYFVCEVNIDEEK